MAEVKRSFINNVNNLGKGLVLGAGAMMASTAAPQDLKAEPPTSIQTRTDGIQLAANNLTAKQTEPTDPYKALDKLVESKELGKEKINPAFKDPIYRNNLAYITEKLAEAQTRGLKGIDLNHVFSLHPIAAHALVRSAYITYHDEAVLKPEITKSILDSRSVQEFGKNSKPTKNDAINFVETFTHKYILPAMEANLERAYDRSGNSYTQEEIKYKTSNGYNNRYKSGYDNISLFISDIQANTVTLIKID